ncbi:MAG: DUF5050 domain-containing protein [Rickettsiales bacterium]|nr:DUF5050 domain-containing protein [Rickettsiales bacterium]
MMKIKKLVTLVLIMALTLGNSAFAGVFFNIKNEDATKTKILFFGFDPADPNARQDAFEIFERVRRNLKTTDLFEVVKNSGKIEIVGEENLALESSQSVVAQKLPAQAATKAVVPITIPTISVETLPDFDRYNKAGVGAIIVAQFNYDQNNNLEMRVRMWDVLDQRQLFGKFYSTSKPNYKKVANLLSDEIFKAITGEKKGHFNSQILYISEAGSIKKRIKKIVMMDFDGENRRVLTDGKDLVLTPIFSKMPNEIYYLRYFENKPQIFNLDLRTSRSKRLGSFHGTTFAASVHPSNTNLVLLSAIFDGNSDIYEMNIADNQARRLTKSPAIDTTASYSPDGKSILFVSDRDGGQQIYLMNISGSDVKKISDGAGSYAKPIYSPDGSMIAFTRIKSGQFYIGTMSANGKNERLLTSGYLVEGAKWSPNGRYLIYSKKRGPYGKDSIPRLCVIDIATGFEFEITTPETEGATDPDWVAL